MAEPSEFDVEDALPRLAIARPPCLPHTIPIVVGGEVHEHEVPVPPVPPVPEPEGPQPGVREIQVPLSDADLARELDEFREADQRRLFGVGTSQVMDFNSRQEIISELNADYYKDSEPDEEYVEDDDELDDDEGDEEDNEIDEDFQRIPEDPEYPPAADEEYLQDDDEGDEEDNEIDEEGFQRIPEDPDYPPPADEEYLQADDELDDNEDDDEDDEEDDEEDNEINKEDFQRIPQDPDYPPLADVDLGQTSDLQADNSEVTVQIDSRTENPCLQTHDVFTEVGEAEQAQHCNSVQIPGSPSGLNGSMSVQTRELTATEAAGLMGGAPNDPTPTTEETHTSEIIMQMNPSSSLIDERTLVASPTPELLLPGTSHIVDSIVICKSSLELPISAATDQRISESGESDLLKPGPATASISEGESMQKPAGAAESAITSSEGESLLKPVV